VKPEFEALASPPGVRIRDPIENAQFELYTDAAVDPEPASTDQFALPVDAAARIEAREIELPQLVNVLVWTPDAELVGESKNQDLTEYEAGRYSLEMGFGSMKVQLAVESALTVRRQENATIIEFSDRTVVGLGARSLHESPAGTITVGDGIEDAMRAVSMFGSALKTQSPERSFPTLRGHPPLVERGEAFDAPDHVSTVDNGVAIEIPETWRALYEVSSLAYYLGADVVPGESTALVLDGERFELSEDGVGAPQAVLKHVFFLDCVTRTEGIYSVQLHEGAAVRDALEFDLKAVYDAPPAERLRRYLEVPVSVTEPHTPQWKLAVDIAPDPGRFESLPFVVSELATVRVPSEDEEPEVTEEPEEIASFLRDATGVVRSASGASDSVSNVVKPDPTDAIEHAWVADGFPLGASKTGAKYYRRRIVRTTRDRDAIQIAIVCNDASMAEEDVVEEFYGARDFFQFEIDVHYDLDRESLASLLRTDIDFLHYIGHVEEGGFQCSDGLFDARTIEETGVRAFLLNACRSYRQGKALVDRGSVGGIVTLTDISNDPAVRVGRALARLLNNGFSLLAGLSVARNVTLFGNQYITIGDGSAQLVQHTNGTPLLVELTEVGDEYEVELTVFPTTRSAMGALYLPHLQNQDIYYLNSGKIDTFRVTPEELREFFQLTVKPVLWEDELVWSDDLLDREIS
jgi:hypothetical protein